MAPRTIDRWINIEFFDLLLRPFELVFGRGPGHVGDFRRGAEMFGGIAVTVEAPSHRKRFDLLDLGHLIDSSMAGDASDPGPEMGGMIEVSVIGEHVDADPFDRDPDLVAFPDRQELFGFGQNESMAVHAGLGWRDVGVGRDFDITMAVTAVDAEVAGMQFVAVVDRLGGAETDIGIDRRSIVPEKADHCD